MSNERQTLTNGTYTFAETKVKNQFYFYRNDKGVLGKVGSTPLELFAQYLIHKVEEWGIHDVYDCEVYYEKSTDGNCIRMTVYDKLGWSKNVPTVEKTESLSSADESQQPQPNFFKNIFGKLFGK